MSQRTHEVVGDVMTADVKRINAMATVREAIDEMAAAGISSLIVDRRDDNDELGLVVVSDIARHVIADGHSTDRTNVYEVMSKPVLTLHADMNIKYAVRLLVRVGFSRAVVVDDRRQPIGIVTLRDMVLRHGGDSA